MVLCCASGNEQVARNASCFKGCAITCAVLGGLHALGMLALGFLFVGLAADCTDNLKGNSCDHLDGRRQLRSGPAHGAAAALSTLVKHAPLLLATATGGASLALPSASLGAALAKSPHSAPVLAPISGPTAGLAGSRRLQTYDSHGSDHDHGSDHPFDYHGSDYDRASCRASNDPSDTVCCWRDSDEPFACRHSGYRPELTGDDCTWFSGGTGQEMECVADSRYTTVARCEAHVSEFCQDQHAAPIAIFFIYMVWEIIGTIIYAVAACKAAKVPPGTQSAGTQMHSQMQPQMQYASAQALPQAGAVAFATAVAQPVAAVPMPQAMAVGSLMPQAVPMGTAEAVPCSSNPLYSGG